MAMGMEEERVFAGNIPEVETEWIRKLWYIYAIVKHRERLQQLTLTCLPLISILTLPC